MIFADSHAHLYAAEFDEDRQQMVERALQAGVKYLLLPNIDVASVDPLLQLCAQYPENVFPMMGLHPCYVPEVYEPVLEQFYAALKTGQYKAVGEIGIDLYWDKSSLARQKDAFIRQCEWALELDLPVSIHTRDATHVVLQIFKQELKGRVPKGVFHCFSGSTEEGREAVKLGFKLGIGGVLTFKNSKLGETLQHFELEDLVLETDAPYLSPAPYRGKRNESSYIPLIAEKLAEVKGVSLETIAEITTQNVKTLFRL